MFTLAKLQPGKSPGSINRSPGQLKLIIVNL
jgi:hypothetical protein